MKKFRKFLLHFLIFCILSILIFSLSGCYSVQSIDDLAYVVALGIDLGKNNNLELTVQLTFPNSADSSSSSGEAAPTIINSVECSSINSGISLLNSYVSKEINLSRLTPEKIKNLEVLINSYLENAFLDYQYKTAKVFEADIDNVGKNLIKNFKNDKEWSNYNWPSNYKNTFFAVDVKTNIKSSFLLAS